MIYFDNSATTKPCRQAIAAADAALNDNWGNPSSLHGLGVKAEKAVTDSREALAEALGCSAGEIVFTSGATESNNAAIFSAVTANGKRRKKIITTAAEHPSVSEPLKRLEEQGFEVVRVKPAPNGELCADEILKLVDKNTLLVTAMLVNNETGAIFDIASLFKKIKAKDSGVITHTDAVQGFLKLKINVKKLSADMISVSGHKVYAPKGVGALYIKKGMNFKPFVLGGGQERGLRSGTESVPLIAAFGAAVKEYGKSIDERLAEVKKLREKLSSELKGLDGAYLHEFKSTLPYVASVTVEGIKSETLLHFLESFGIYVSSGSACSKGKKSDVLAAFGYTDKELDTTVRVSFCADNTEDEVVRLIAAIKEAQQSLAKIKY